MGGTEHNALAVSCASLLSNCTHSIKEGVDSITSVSCTQDEISLTGGMFQGLTSQVGMN